MCFALDLLAVSCWDDLRADDNGVWVYGKPHQNYCVEFNENTNALLDAKLLEDIKYTNDANIFTLVRLYHQHKSTPEF